jgi:hypothetical protein
MVTKVEKSYCISIWSNPKLEFENGKPAGKPRIEETSTTIPGVGVGFK